MSDPKQEKKNRNVGLWTSLGVHAGLFLVLFFVIAWRAPDPPLPEYGIELNFGLDDQGSGDIQPDEPAGEAGQSVTSETVAEQVPEQQSETPAEISETAEEKEVTPVPSKTESPVSVKEAKKPVAESKEAAKAEAKTPTKESTVTAPSETTKETAKEEATRKGEAASQGDDTNKTGDKGSEQGTLDAKALYGTPGGGGGGTGMNLQMSGWTWADEPSIPQLPDNENGRVVFEIECDENGDITGITTLERTLSPKAEQLLKDMIRKNALVRTSGGKVPERSRGKLVFVLRTK
jgi:outer membrane biosynthesis protein TonB